MKIKDLIEIISKLDQEKRVVVQGYEGGYCDIEVDGVVEIKLKLNEHEEPYYGPHESGWRVDDLYDKVAYCISR